MGKQGGAMRPGRQNPGPAAVPRGMRTPYGSDAGTTASSSGRGATLLRRILVRVGLVVLGIGGAAATIALVVVLRGDDGVVYVDPVDGRRVPYFRRDRELGYAALPDRMVRARRIDGGKVIYDAIYRTGPDGLRVVPGGGNFGEFVFFGCSFTVGDGVEDEETLPAAFVAALGGRVGARNFGFHGYGPHQMVRLLETRRVASLPRRPVLGAFYQSLPNHAGRAGGRSPWDTGGPRYVLDDRAPSRISYAGPFHTFWLAEALRATNKVPPIRKLRERIFFANPSDATEYELHARLTLRAATLVREQLGASLSVVHWDDGSAQDERFVARLQDAGLDLVRVSSIIPRIRWPELSIPNDGHPTPEAYALIAGTLAARLERLVDVPGRADSHSADGDLLPTTMK